jgi:hypothetical protein
MSLFNVFEVSSYLKVYMNNMWYSSMVGKTSCVGKSDEGLFKHTFSTTISTSYV